eukprot:gene35377-43618_t
MSREDFSSVEMDDHFSQKNCNLESSTALIVLPTFQNRNKELNVLETAETDDDEKDVEDIYWEASVVQSCQNNSSEGSKHVLSLQIPISPKKSAAGHAPSLFMPRSSRPSIVPPLALVRSEYLYGIYTNSVKQYTSDDWCDDCEEGEYTWSQWTGCDSYTFDAEAAASVVPSPIPLNLSDVALKDLMIYSPSTGESHSKNRKVQSSDGQAVWCGQGFRVAGREGFNCDISVGSAASTVSGDIHTGGSYVLSENDRCLSELLSNVSSSDALTDRETNTLSSSVLFRDEAFPCGNKRAVSFVVMSHHSAPPPNHMARRRSYSSPYSSSSSQVLLYGSKKQHRVEAVEAVEEKSDKVWTKLPLADDEEPQS